MVWRDLGRAPSFSACLPALDFARGETPVHDQPRRREQIWLKWLPLDRFCAALFV